MASTLDSSCNAACMSLEVLAALISALRISIWAWRCPSSRENNWRSNSGSAATLDSCIEAEDEVAEDLGNSNDDVEEVAEAVSPPTAPSTPSSEAFEARDEAEE